MLNNFWENVGARLSEKWSQHLFGPAFLFWVGSLLVIINHYGLAISWNFIQALEIYQQLLLLLLSLILLVTSSIVMRALRHPLLRFFEGYWPWPLSYVANALRDFQKSKIRRIQTHWNALKHKETNESLTREDREALAHLEISLHYTPPDPNELQPTSLGNILRAAESAPRYKYGLDTIVCWPRLWMILPTDVQEDISSSRANLDELVELCAWGILFILWSWWTIWAGLFGFVWSALVYAMLIRSASNYADLLESAFDIHRWELYKSMHWPIPLQSGKKEIEAGLQLTEFLWRGPTGSDVQYIKGGE